MPQGPPERGGEINLVLDREALTYSVLSLSLGWAAESTNHRCSEARSEFQGEKREDSAGRGQKQCKSRRRCWTPQMFSSYSLMNDLLPQRLTDDLPHGLGKKMLAHSVT